VTPVTKEPRAGLRALAIGVVFVGIIGGAIWAGIREENSRRQEAAAAAVAPVQKKLDAAKTRIESLELDLTTEKRARQTAESKLLDVQIRKGVAGVRECECDAPALLPDPAARLAMILTEPRSADPMALLMMRGTGFGAGFGPSALDPDPLSTMSSAHFASAYSSSLSPMGMLRATPGATGFAPGNSVIELAEETMRMSSRGQKCTFTCENAGTLSAPLAGSTSPKPTAPKTKKK
jgi:hypothetical protein